MTLYGFIKIKTAKMRAKWGYSLDISHYQHLSLNQRQVLEWENFVENKSEGFRWPLIGDCWQEEAGGRLTERGANVMCWIWGAFIAFCGWFWDKQKLATTDQVLTFMNRLLQTCGWSFWTESGRKFWIRVLLSYIICAFAYSVSQHEL